MRYHIFRQRFELLFLCHTHKNNYLLKGKNGFHPHDTNEPHS